MLCWYVSNTFVRSMWFSKRNLFLSTAFTKKRSAGSCSVGGDAAAALGGRWWGWRGTLFQRCLCGTRIFWGSQETDGDGRQCARLCFVAFPPGMSCVTWDLLRVGIRGDGSSFVYGNNGLDASSLARLPNAFLWWKTILWSSYFRVFSLRVVFYYW